MEFTKIITHLFVLLKNQYNVLTVIDKSNKKYDCNCHSVCKCLGMGTLENVVI